MLKLLERGDRDNWFTVCLKQDLVQVSETEFGGVRTSGTESFVGREQGYQWQCPGLPSHDPASVPVFGEKSASGGEPLEMAMKSRWLFTPLPPGHFFGKRGMVETGV